MTGGLTIEFLSDVSDMLAVSLSVQALNLLLSCLCIVIFAIAFDVKKVPIETALFTQAVDFDMLEETEAARKLPTYPNRDILT